MLAAVIGGPIGMTGYVLAINHGRVHRRGRQRGLSRDRRDPLPISFSRKNAVVPLDLPAGDAAGRHGLSYSPELNITDFWLGIVGAMMCAFGWGIRGGHPRQMYAGPRREGRVCPADPPDHLGAGLRHRTAAPAARLGLHGEPVHLRHRLAAARDRDRGVFLPRCPTCATTARSPRSGAIEVHGGNVTYAAWAIFFTAVFLGDTRRAHADDDHLRAHRHRLRHSDRGRRQGPLFQKQKHNAKLSKSCQKVLLFF